MSVFSCFPFLQLQQNVTDPIHDKQYFQVPDWLRYNVSAALLIPNIVLIVGLIKTNKVLTRSQKLYIFLSATDAALGLCVTITKIASLSSTVKIPCARPFGGSLGIGVINFLTQSGAGTFLVIAILRNFAIRKPLKHFETKWVVTLISIWLLITTIQSGWAYIIFSPEYTSREYVISGWLILNVSRTGIIAMVIVFNAWSTKHLRQHKSNNITNQTRHKQNYKAVVTLNLITIVYVLCFLPCIIFYFTMLHFLLHNHIDLVSEGFKYYCIIYSPVYCCSGLNSIIYISKDSAIKTYYMKCFMKSDKQETIRLSNIRESYSHEQMDKKTDL